MKKLVKFKTTGALIKRLRLKKGLTQRQLCDVTKISHEQTMSAIERGLNGIPKDRISLFASALGVPQKKIVSAIIRQQKQRLAC